MTIDPRTSIRPRRNSLPFIALGIILLAVAIYLLARPQTLPELAVEPARIDLGSLDLGAPASFEIRLTNTGDDLLRFQQVPYIEILEGC